MLGLSCQSLQCFVSSLIYKLFLKCSISITALLPHSDKRGGGTGAEEKRGEFVPGSPFETQGWERTPLGNSKVLHSKLGFVSTTEPPSAPMGSAKNPEAPNCPAAAAAAAEVA